MSLRSRLAHNLQLIRKSRKISQAQLARMSGVNQTHIGYIENMRTSASVDVVESIAAALDLDPCILLARSSVKFPGTKMKSLQLLPITFKKGEAAYCFWTKDGMEFHPISRDAYRTALTMMALLQANGFSGKDLLEQGKKLHIPFND